MKGSGDQAKECELHLEGKAQLHKNFKLARGVSQFTTWRLRGSSPEKSGRWDGAGRQRQAVVSGHLRQQPSEAQIQEQVRRHP